MHIFDYWAVLFVCLVLGLIKEKNKFQLMKGKNVTQIFREI